MLDTIKYVNTNGQTQFFSKNNCLCNTKALREFLYTINNKRLFTNQPKTISIELVFAGDPKKKDAMIDLLDYDSIKNECGRLYVNDWYILCKFIGISAISKDARDKVRMDLQFQADSIEWSKETTYNLAPASATDTGRDHPYDYLSDFSRDASMATEIINNEASEADIRIDLDITDADSVEFTITAEGGDAHNYEVDLTDYESSVNDHFQIDTQAKTVELTHGGSTSSVFGGASDDYYIFQKIASGKSYVTADMQMQISVIEHRRTPRWKI